MFLWHFDTKVATSPEETAVPFLRTLRLNPYPVLHVFLCQQSSCLTTEWIQSKDRAGWKQIGVFLVVGRFLRLLWTQISPRTQFAKHHSYKGMWQLQEGKWWVLTLVERHSFVSSSFPACETKAVVAFSRCSMVCLCGCKWVPAELPRRRVTCCFIRGIFLNGKKGIFPCPLCTGFIFTNWKDFK